MKIVKVNTINAINKVLSVLENNNVTYNNEKNVFFKKKEIYSLKKYINAGKSLNKLEYKFLIEILNWFDFNVIQRGEFKNDLTEEEKNCIFEIIK